MTINWKILLMTTCDWVLSTCQTPYISDFSTDVETLVKKSKFEGGGDSSLWY